MGRVEPFQRCELQNASDRAFEDNRQNQDVLRRRVANTR